VGKYYGERVEEGGGTKQSRANSKRIPTHNNHNNKTTALVRCSFLIALRVLSNRRRTMATRKLGTAHGAFIFPGDKVRIDGLVSASQYNGLRGIVVDFSNATRCGVHFIYNGERKLLSIQMHNLVLLHRAKKTTRNIYHELDISPMLFQDPLAMEGRPKPKGHRMMAMAWGDENEIDVLTELNKVLLQQFNDVVCDDNDHQQEDEQKDDEKVIDGGGGGGGEAPDDSEDDDNGEDFGSDTDSNDSDVDEQKMTMSIIKKWEKQQIFVRFMNGDTTHCHAANLDNVSLKDALEHIHDWVVDWDMELTDKEIQLVQRPAWRLRLLMRGNEDNDEQQGSIEHHKHENMESADTDSPNANKNELINSILKKWRDQGCFLRFDPTSSAHSNKWHKNLVRVSLDDAMDHIDDWVVDWDIDLTHKEIVLVRDPIRRKTLLKLHLQTEWDYYYWDDDETNQNGESIKTCMERYGVTGWYQRAAQTAVALVFLSSEKTHANTWLLGMKNLDGQLSMRNHENCPTTYRLSIDTSLGVSITALLADSVFEETGLRGDEFGTSDHDHEVIMVFDEGEDVGFMYTIGLHPQKREFFALDVRRGDAMDTAALMNFLATRYVLDKQTACSDRNFNFVIHAIDDEDFDRATKEEHLCQMDPDAKTFMLVPLGMSFCAIHTKNGIPLIARYDGIPSADPTSIDGV